MRLLDKAGSTEGFIGQVTTTLAGNTDISERENTNESKHMVLKACCAPPRLEKERRKPAKLAGTVSQNWMRNFKTEKTLNEEAGP